jgi:hypothetical protein
MKPAQPESERAAADPELAPLQASFERGDFATLHDQLAALPEAKRNTPGARPLSGATTADPAHVGVLALCVLALIAITLQYLR